MAVRGELRASDVLGRLSGGELAALLVQTEPDGIEVVARRLRARLEELQSGERVPETILGRAAYPSAGETVEALVDAARRDQEKRGRKDRRAVN